jgi:inner membrane protein
VTLPLVSLLDGIAPGWWLALALVLAGLEALTVTTHLIWPALAAALTALVLFLAPQLSGAAQLGLFALLTIGLVLAGRGLFGRYLRPGAASSGLNRRAQALVGREAVVESFAVQDGRVKIDGVLWPARLDETAAPLSPGDRVRVTATDGIVVRIRPL